MKTATIDREIAQLSLLNQMAHAFAQISAARMQKTRGHVLVNRDFLLDVRGVFEALLASYHQEVRRLAQSRLLRRGKNREITFLSHNSRTVAVLLAANSGWYGDIVQRTLDLFLQEVRNSTVEATIVGRMGRVLFEQAEPNRPYTYFDLRDYNPDPERVAEIIQHLVQYENIHVYHGKFNSFIDQKPQRFDISAHVEARSADKHQPMPKYYFEPDLPRILASFESEIFSSLFDQTVQEEQLAKLASRAYSMNQAEGEIEHQIGQKKYQRLQAVHRIRNRKQRTTLAGALWRGR